MFELLEYNFIQNALFSAILISIAIGIVGSLIVVNKITFLSGAIAHSSYGGIGICVYLGLPVFLGANIFAVISAILIAFITLNNKSRVDSIIGMMWATGMAIGIIFIDLSSGYNVDLMSYLFGSILAVSNFDIYYMIALDIFIILLVGVFYQQILIVSYDSQFALLRGISLKFFYTLILVLCALSVVAAIKVVGLILVIALLTIPTYLAEMFVNKLSSMMIVSTLLSIIFTLGGLSLSYIFDISSGASIIILAISILSCVKLWKYLY